MIISGSKEQDVEGHEDELKMNTSTKSVLALSFLHFNCISNTLKYITFSSFIHVYLLAVLLVPAFAGTWLRFLGRS